MGKTGLTKRCVADTVAAQINGAASRKRPAPWHRAKSPWSRCAGQVISPVAPSIEEEVPMPVDLEELAPGFRRIGCLRDGCDEPAAVAETVHSGWPLNWCHLHGGERIAEQRIIEFTARGATEKES